MRGDLSLIVKQQSLTEFNVKLTPMGIAVSLPLLEFLMIAGKSIVIYYA